MILIIKWTLSSTVYLRLRMYQLHSGQGPPKSEQQMFGLFAMFGIFQNFWRSDCSVFELFARGELFGLFGVRAVRTVSTVRPVRVMLTVRTLRLFGLFVNLWKFYCSVFGGPWLRLRSDIVWPQCSYIADYGHGQPKNRFELPIFRGERVPGDSRLELHWRSTNLLVAESIFRRG